MKTIIKYTIIGIVVAFITLLVHVSSVDVFAFVNLCSVFICTGIIVHHIEKRLPLAHSDEDDSDADE